MKKMFLQLLLLCLWHLAGGFGELLSVNEGESVTINPGLTEIKDGDKFQWTFGPGSPVIAEIKKQNDSFTVNDDVLDGRFRDRLKLDNQTGSLTITNTTIKHAGHYLLHLSGGIKYFNLVVFAQISVIDGESVTLNSHLTEIKDDEQIQWKCGSGNTVIAAINKESNSFTVNDDVLDGRFRDRLKLDNQTGSLTITNTTIKHAGEYHIQIISGLISFLLAVIVPVMEGESVTLNSDLTEIKDNYVIYWRVGSGNTLIAEINKQNDSFTVYDDVLDGRFRDRLKLDNQTGSLTITNTTIKHAGDYELESGYFLKSSPIRLSVYAPLPVPVISSDSSPCSSSSSSSCSLVCSVVNVSHVTLSWFNGSSLLSSISASDLSISLSLPLEVEYQDKNNYSCVLNHPISHQTQHLDIPQLCHTCAVHCCGPTELVIRLVLSVLVGVAIILLVVYDVRSRRAERDQAQIHTSGSE